MLLIDLSHTSHSQAQTGIQRVCRQLFTELRKSAATEPVTYDPYRKSWRPLQLWELDSLASSATSSKRGSKWPWRARWGGRLARITGRSTPPPPLSNALIAPEVFSPAVAANFSQLFQRVTGPRIALFHDAIALKFPELSPPGTVARFPAYLQELLAFDAVAAVSADSAQSLADYWAWLGIQRTPRIVTIPLPLPKSIPAGATSLHPTSPAALSVKPQILSVGTLEGRKNHVALLDACEQLWSAGVVFELRLIGMAHAVTGRAALDRIAALRKAGRPVRYDGPVTDEILDKAYAACTFTVYPSLIEGFGLPVLESVAHGKPCVCSAQGALGESARGGGCCALESVSAASLAETIRLLLRNPDKLDDLRRECTRRTFRSWSDYTADLLACVAEAARPR
jgi:glycosyltransferase involved in cell wall biosynthesis